MSHDVFISYSSRDREAADTVCGALEGAGMACWIAPRDIQPGETWGGSIIEAIIESKVMLIIFSSAANDSHQVVREVERASEKRVVVIPFRIEQVEPTADMEYFLSSRHWLDAFEPPFSDHVSRLVDTVKTVLESASLEQLREGEPEGGPAVGPSLREIARLASKLFDEGTVAGFGGRHAIAVLPFDNVGGDPEQEYFADGITEDLITRLSVWRDFPVIARNSSFAYKGKTTEAKRVSRELGVRYLVEGSVRRGGERVRISVQLIDATTGETVWAERFDREMTDIFELQDEISEAIVGSMHPELTYLEQERSVRSEPQNLDAWDCTLQGQWHYHRRTAEGNAKAREFFERAIEIDPKLASAHAWLAMSHYYEIVNQQAESPVQAVMQIFQSAQTCVGLDDKDPQGHIALGAAYSLVGQRDDVFASLELAIELNPSQTDAYFQLGLFLAILGRPDDAIEKIERAMRLSPRDRFRWEFLSGTAMAHFAARRYEEAVEKARHSLHHRPDWLLSQGILAASYVQLDRIDDARKAREELSRMHPEFTLTALGALLAAGDPDVAERLLGGLREAGLPE